MRSQAESINPGSPAEPRANSQFAVDGCASARRSPMYQGARLFCSGPHVYTTKSQAELAYIDILANSKIRLNSVEGMTKIQNTSQSFAETKHFRVAAREHTLAPPGRHRPRHSRITHFCTPQSSGDLARTLALTHAYNCSWRVVVTSIRRIDIGADSQH